MFLIWHIAAIWLPLLAAWWAWCGAGRAKSKIAVGFYVIVYVICLLWILGWLAQFLIHTQGWYKITTGYVR